MKELMKELGFKSEKEFIKALKEAVEHGEGFAGDLERIMKYHDVIGEDE